MMDIYIATGVGEGTTKLSSFDAALKDAGVYNYNLIPLSSIIPPQTKVKVVDQYKTPEGEYGYRLYIVQAVETSDELGKYVAAGLGWYQISDGRGVFVEHHIKGETKVAVSSEIKARIKNSIRDLCEFRGFKFTEKKVKSVLAIAKIKKWPTTVLAVAVYESQGWKG